MIFASSVARSRRPANTTVARLAWSGLLLSFVLLLGSGCQVFRREMPRPGRTTLDAPLVVVPATTMGNYLIVQGKWDKRGPYNFLVDTGASVTLVAPELAERYSVRNPAPTATPLVRVKSADGETVLLSPATLRRIELGGARFDNVQVLVYDCAPISAHLGIRIDGVVGFPLFRETLLTLDYPQSRLLLQRRTAAPLLPGAAIPFNNDRKTPIIPLRLGDHTFVALIDSGSDAMLSLNPAGLDPTFVVPPRVGATIATLSGDREQHIGRLAQNLRIGQYTIDRPVVDLTDELTSIGGGLLKHFTVTFDQEHSRVTFHRDAAGPVPSRSYRSTGLSFSKTPAYWRVVSVIPESPAAEDDVQPGDLVTHINGRPVGEWDITRYQDLVASAMDVTYTFLEGTRANEKRLGVFDLVP